AGSDRGSGGAASRHAISKSHDRRHPALRHEFKGDTDQRRSPGESRACHSARLRESGAGARGGAKIAGCGSTAGSNHRQTWADNRWGIDAAAHDSRVAVSIPDDKQGSGVTDPGYNADANTFSSSTE